MNDRPAAPAPVGRLAVRALLVPAVAVALAAGIVGGLVRAGVGWPEHIIGGAWLGEAVLAHAQLLVCAFLGSVIGIERAVAVKQHWAFAAPLASAASGVLALTGAATAAAWLFVVAAAVFVAVNAVVVMRQR